MVLEFLLRAYERTGAADRAGDGRRAPARRWPAAGCTTSSAGGFARYSVDADWVVPHFEKMLYDNALLLRAYLHWWRRHAAIRSPAGRAETADFLLRDLRTAEGGFASALDADTEGVEGVTYVWTPAQLVEVLGAADGALRRRAVRGHRRRHVRARRVDAAAAARSRRRARAGRSSARGCSRPGPTGRSPARDDKVVTSWNGLAIGALAEAAVLLGEPRYLDAARDAPSCCSTSTSSTGGCGGPRATAGSATRPAWPTTTATWPTGC